MRYPYERFLRFLVSRKARLNETLHRYRLPSVGGLWESRYRSQIRQSAPPSVVRYLDGEGIDFRAGFLEWADSEGFGDLWRFQAEFGGGEPSPDLNTAFQIFINPTGRYTLGVLLFSDSTDEEIIQGTKEKLSIELTQGALDTYRRLFWDTTLVSRNDWGSFIKTLSPSERTYLAAGINGGSNESVRNTLSLPNRKDPDEILIDIANRAHDRFVAAIDQPNPEIGNARYWADLAVKASNALKSSRGRGIQQEDEKPITDDRLESMFAVEITTSNHVTLEELQGQFVRPETGGGR